MSWLRIRQPLDRWRAFWLKACAFCIPLVVWCAISYLPFIWHPQMKVIEAGDSRTYPKKAYVPKDAYYTEQQRLLENGLTPMVGKSTNPMFLPAPHEVGMALKTAFTTEPLRKGAPWLHERILQSVKVLAMGFLLACAVALPLGVLCGTYDLFSKLIEPFIDFMRYMPAPAFGALMVAILGFAEAPKVSIVFIGLFFNMLLVTANTVRSLDVALLEAAQTLGARGVTLLTRVVIPGSLPSLYTDLRIALGFGWVYLTIAELIGEMSGITEFINQNGKFRNYPNVFTGIIILGMLGFLTDQFLGWLGKWLFPWQPRAKSSRRVRSLKVVAPFAKRAVPAPSTVKPGVSNANP